ncbi:hypothetical protein QEH52_15045 [Coraliomargarita sp. SDUM461003]|uniref:Uncharacterized protein n=1 Tax=Thalassobacterium maritimum TaxID=3041265 RepID=A0ABU1AXG4_9BACT|nr:hypothetical protein [Coraliomargarita sp. SDUM461003]MBT64038.1 hypothetical protein [Puniceicoccaceae bacterium]MDQ8208842.1 hypothetical protein [Coraliomargarita sp. SDUM461003]|tara:strand:- start:128 stop:505 length:378 start_codon:yes stop_codon:yes gene_type:complete
MLKLSPKARKHVIALIFSMVVVTLGSAFAIVWMQQQISRTAQNSKQLESQLAETSRKLRYLDERIASYHQPVVLQSKVAGVLRPSVEDQVVFVQEQQLATGRTYAVAQPYEVSMDLALLDFDSSR